MTEANRKIESYKLTVSFKKKTEDDKEAQHLLDGHNYRKYPYFEVRDVNLIGLVLGISGLTRK